MSLFSLRDARPELAAGIDHFLSSEFMRTLYERFPAIRNHLLLDEIRPALIVDDPQLYFYLSHTPASKLIRNTGERQNRLRNKVFVSYSHDDAPWLDRLRVHLKPLERKGEIEYWDDTQIQPGARWRQEIEEALDTAKAALLLVSANFLASTFIAENELPPLLAAAEERGTKILPVIVSPSLFDDTELAQFQAVNAPTKPLLNMATAEQEEVLVRVAQTIRGALSAP